LSEGRPVEALGTMAKICTFLAGIFFTCIILILQQREKFYYYIDTVIFKFRIQALDTYVAPLTLTFIIFTFATIIYASACGTVEQRKRNKLENKASFLFGLGFFSMFFSLFCILCQASFWIGLMGAGLAFLLFIYWIR